LTTSLALFVFHKTTYLFPGKSGVALLYLFIGEESKRNGGLLTENPEDDLNKIDFEGKGIQG
jgi:hypothetical protein